jgi:hypothetical protein
MIPPQVWELGASSTSRYSFMASAAWKIARHTCGFRALLKFRGLPMVKLGEKEVSAEPRPAPNLAKSARFRQESYWLAAWSRT